MGPSILDAVYHVTSAAGAANDSLYIIFSENLNAASVQAADFNFNGGLAVGDVGGIAGGSIARVGRNLVVMTGFTTAFAAGDSVQLSAKGVITSSDPSGTDSNEDVSLVAIRTGPAIYRAEIINDLWDNRPNGDVVRLYFTHEIVPATLSTTDARVDFEMPEFGTGTANLTAAIVGGSGGKAVDITFGNQQAPANSSHGKVLAGISRIHIKTGALQGNFTGDATAAEANPAGPWHTIDDNLFTGLTTVRGPYPVSAGYNDRGTPGLSDDVLTLVFSDDVDPSTVSVTDFAFSTAPTSPALGSNDGDHVLTITDFTGASGTLAGGTVTLTGSISDFQGNPSPSPITWPVAASPIIVLARYQDGGDSDPTTDLVEVFFDEPVTGSDADTTDFSYYGFVSNGLIITDNVDNDSLLTIVGFTLSNNWRMGNRIALRPGAFLRGAGPSSNGANVSATGDNWTSLIRDYSAPRTLHFALNTTYLRDTQDPGAGPDTAYYAFDERDLDDSNYYVIFTRKATAVDRIYVETHFNNARYIVNPNPQSGSSLLNRNVITTYDITPGVGIYSDGQIIQLGDNVNFGILAVDQDGNIALNTTSNLFVGALIAGPVPPPRDHDCVFNEVTGFTPVPGVTTDTDMIHITGTRNPEEHFIFGDAGSAIGADSIRVYDDAGLATLLGSGPANKVTGAWNAFSIGQPTHDFVYVVAVERIGSNSTLSAPTQIRNDLITFDVLYKSTFKDPLNELRLYSPGDTVRILGAAVDTMGSPSPMVDANLARKSDLLVLSADFRGFSTKAGADSVVFISLGANKNDEDDDWLDDGGVAFNNTVLSANGIKDYPEPYVDENGNGRYDCGETFVDYTGAAYTPKIRDNGDSNLDSNDPQEHGWYYVEYWIDPTAMTADPNGGVNFAVLPDVNIPIKIVDNGITSQAALDQLSSELPGQANRVTMSFETAQSLSHLTNAAGDSAFVATLDALAPTVSEITYLARQSSLTHNSDYDPTPHAPQPTNILEPGDHTYELPSGVASPYINFVDSTLSDDEVLFLATQIDTTANTSTSQTEGGWRYMSMDPPGDRGTPGHNDGKPGIPFFSDDYDTTTYAVSLLGYNTKTNGIDDDENGQVDEDGEGVDLKDPQVVDAMQADAAADAAALSGGDGIYRTNDGIDNDGDAFFRFNPFTGQAIWFNIDESTTNGIDDDGDGTVDNAGEVENYNPALDNDEDGMMGGSVTYLPLGPMARTIGQLTAGLPGTGVIGVRAFEDPALLARYAGSHSTKPTTAMAQTVPGYMMSYIDKTSDVIGNGSPAWTQKGGKDFFANPWLALGAFNIINRVQGKGFTKPGQATIVGNGDGGFPNFGNNIEPTGPTGFNWDFRFQTDRNIDLYRLQHLYDLVDGAEYRMRAVAVDQAYNFNPAWAVGFKFKLDSTAPVVCIPPAQNSTTPGTGALPEFNDFVDVKPAVPGLQVFDKGAHPGPYTLRADIVSGNDIKEVHFQVWDQVGMAWVDLPPAAPPVNPDQSFPYTLFWDPPLLNNNPPARADTFYFRAYAVDEFGNTEAQGNTADPHFTAAPTLANGPHVTTCVDDGRVWELQVIVIDGTAPSACIDQVGADYKPCDGAAVPAEQAVDVSAWFDDNDGDPNTNDVINVRFEFTPVGQDNWQPFASLTGVPGDGFLRDPSGIKHPVIHHPRPEDCGPVPSSALETTVTWDTRGLSGSYEIRAVATDIEGNTSILTSCVFTVTVDTQPLRAYIQPVVVGSNSLDTCGLAATDTLFAQVFIHDRSVSKVEFQYYHDTNGNGLADDGNTWVSIYTQGANPQDRKGDVTLRAGNVPFYKVSGNKHFKLPGATYLGLTDFVRFWDPDHNGYSSIDPIVVDSNNNHKFDNGDFVIAFGPGNASPQTDDPLADFSDNEYIAQRVPAAIDYANDYIMQDNLLNPHLCDFCTAETDLWRATWDITGLNGKYLVRAIATDNLGNTDSDLPGSPIPTSSISVDSSIPKATITSLTLPDGSTIGPPVNGQYISASNSFFYVNATTTSTDVKKVLFEYSVNGGATWDTLDVNDDQDMFSDLNGNCRFDKSVDEIFIDVDGNNHYSAGDIVLWKGDNGVVDTPMDPGSAYSLLHPLVSEDPNDGIDNDGDGKVDEDSFFPASALGGQSPEDYFPPYSVPFPFCNLVFQTETNVMFRAVATDSSGNSDCNPTAVHVTVGDNQPPETDVVVAVIHGDSLNIETVLRGTLNGACLDTSLLGPMHLLVTAEDQALITGIDILYRRVPEVPTFPAPAYIPAGLTDTTYPYEFDWNITTLADGTYEFFPQATDANGNKTPPPVNPYRFTIMRSNASVTSATLLGSGLPATYLKDGQTVVLTANVSPAPTGEGSVRWYYAPRFMNRPVTGISTTFPYISGVIHDDEGITPPSGNGNDEKVMIGGVAGHWIAPSLFASTPGKTYLDYTVRDGGHRLEFGAPVPIGTAVTVSFNVEEWTQIGDTDTNSPFSTQWEVPAITDHDEADAVDLMATYEPAGSCEEQLLSEGFILPWVETTCPTFTVYGIHDVNADGKIRNLDDNWPGNALAISVGLDNHNDPIGATIGKMSGDYAMFFLRASDEDAISDAKDDLYTSVKMLVTNSSGTDSCIFQKMPFVNDPPQVIHKVLFLSDFPTLDPSRVENVTITVDGFELPPAQRTFPMVDDGTNGDLVAGDGHYTVTLNLPPKIETAGSEPSSSHFRDYKYEFKIDLVGEQFITTPDPRNQYLGNSYVRIPALPYWWCENRLDDNSLFKQNDVNHVVVTATDKTGKTASTTECGNAGQIDLILDREAPQVAKLWLDRDRIAPNHFIKVNSVIVDPVPADINIISVPHVLFQVSPDAAHKVWINWFDQDDPAHGWGGEHFLYEEWPFDPLHDGIDNDGDGLFDEPDEANFVYQIRCVPTDDCFNTGYSNLQNPPVVATVMVDSQPPVCDIGAPANGTIFPHGSVVHIVTKPVADTDVNYVSFQYNLGDGWVAIDATPNDDTDPYDAEFFDGKHTPQSVRNQDGTYSVDWNTSFLTQADYYIRLRCVARDIAGNFEGNLGNPLGEPGDPVIEFVTVLINDQTAPMAALTDVIDQGPSYLFKSIVDPTLAIHNEVVLVGIASGGRTGDVATVLIQYSPDGETWHDANVTNIIFPFLGGGTQQTFFAGFNTKSLNLPDGDVWLRSAAMDHDGNLQGDANKNGILESNETVPGSVKVRVDNTEPAMWLTEVGPVNGSPVPDHTLIQYDLWPREVARGGEFQIDDISQRLPTELTFRAADPNDGSVDVIDDIYLQFYDDWTTPENPVWRPAFPSIPAMDANHNGVIDDLEVHNWINNFPSYLEALDDFYSAASGWRFSFRDAAGNNAPPGPPADGSWLLTFGSIDNLKLAMGEQAAPDKVAPTAEAGRMNLQPKGLAGPALPDKEYHFRALAIDYAGNANTDYMGHILRIDATKPEVADIFAGNNEIEAGGGGGFSAGTIVHVAGGDDVPLAALVYDNFPVEGRAQSGRIATKLQKQGFDPKLPGTDSESSGILGVKFEYMPERELESLTNLPLSANWTTIGLGTFDSVSGLWKITWTTPKNLSFQGPQAGQGSSTTDSLYAIRAVAVDSAGNWGSDVRNEAVNVQDVTPPDDTEIVGIDGTRRHEGATYPPITNEETVRSAAGTIVSRSVDVIAATQAGDPSMVEDASFATSDIYMPTVFFEARPHGSSADWKMINSVNHPIEDDKATIGTAPKGTAQAAEAHLGPHWLVEWNTLAVDGSGARIWSDGQYDVRAYARDVWGNTEILTGNEAPMTVLVTIDNTAPVVEIDANPATPLRDVEATIERNDPKGYTFQANTQITNEDVVVTYWYKLSTDLNVPASWHMVSPGFDATDVNPDNNRPFSFDWNTNTIADCGEQLVPGETYDIAASATDLLGNTESVVTCHDAGGSIRLHVTDTTAPKAVITELKRNVGNAAPVMFPESVRVRGLEYLQATILNGARDVQSVQFYYQPKSGAAPDPTKWVLADGDINTVGDLTWRLTNWDSSPLADGDYWFAAIATDCFSNKDASPATVVITIDRTPPQFVAVTPTNNQKLVPDMNGPNSPRVIDLIVKNTDNDVDYTTFNTNAIWFEVKKSSDPDQDSYWTSVSSQELKDNGPPPGTVQPTYSASYNIRNLADGLYDWRVVASDVAGNQTKFVFATETVVDNTPPVIEISDVAFPNRQDLTIQPVNGGILPDISAGEQVKLYVTASDNEPAIPPSHATNVYEVQFYLGNGPDGSGTYPQNLGTAGFDGTRNQYFIIWNTTGLPDGNYSIYAKGEDDVRNIGTSQWVVGKVKNPAKPLAQVSAFNPDLLSEITKGTNDRVYALTFGEKLASTMFFQYRTVPVSGTAGDWVNIGAATDTGERLSTRELGLLTQSLWFSNMRISDIADNTVLEFRAVAVAPSTLDSLGYTGNVATEPVTNGEARYYGRSSVGKGLNTADGQPGDFSGQYDLANTPIIKMIKLSRPSGQAYLDFDEPGLNLITDITTQGVDFSRNGLVTVKTGNPKVSPFVTLVAEDGHGHIDEAIPEMNRRIDDGTVWTGDILGNINNFTNIHPSEGARVAMFATAHLGLNRTPQNPGPAPRIDMKWKTWFIHQVTPNAGSNGVAGIDGKGYPLNQTVTCNGRVLTDNNPTDPFAVEVPPGAANSNSGMLLERVVRPVTPAEQDLYINAFGPTYKVKFLNDNWSDAMGNFNDSGWFAKGWIRFNPSDPAIKNKGQITVRFWSGSDETGWVVSDAIRNVVVDTCLNVVSFNFEPDEISTYGGSTNDYGIVMSLVANDRFSPVQVLALPYTRGYTDEDPIFKVILTNPGGTEIDPGSIRVFIDGVEVAGTQGSTFFRYLLYRGSWADLDDVDQDGRRWAVTYGWPCDKDLGLASGNHTLEVWFSNGDRTEYYGVDHPWPFQVDRTPPTIIMNGAFVGDPKQNNTPAYVGTDARAITVKLIDSESGVKFREDRMDNSDYDHYWWSNVEDECRIARYVVLFDEWFYSNNIPIQFNSDDSFKYDLWRVNHPDHANQNSIDTIEERTLLHTGTADELWPNVTFSADGDTLTVPLYILGGGEIKDGDVLEVTLYSRRYEIAPLNNLNEFLNFIKGSSDNYDSYGSGWWIDFSTKRLVEYAASIADNVLNVGSRFVEQRFIVDTSAPTVDVTSPGVSCDASTQATPIEPVADYTFTANLDDGQNGSGVDPSTVQVTISGPTKTDENGQPLPIIDGTPTITATTVSFVIKKDHLLTGQYRIRITGKDKTGNAFDKTCILFVGGGRSVLTSVYAYPNPFNPRETDVTITFTNNNPANVMISLYDFNGDKVRSINVGQVGVGPQTVKWGGDAEDGTPLANGVYLARIEAKDGKRTVTDVVKIALWRD